MLHSVWIDCDIDRLNFLFQFHAISHIAKMHKNKEFQRFNQHCLVSSNWPTSFAYESWSGKMESNYTADIKLLRKWIMDESYSSVCQLQGSGVSRSVHLRQDADITGSHRCLWKYSYVYGCMLFHFVFIIFP